MECFGEAHEMYTHYHESIMEKSRNITSVRTSTSVLCVRADLFVLCSAVINGLTNSDPHVDDVYNQFGPTPCICFDFLSNDALLIKCKAHSQEALRTLSLEKLDVITEMEAQHNRCQISHPSLVKWVPRKDLICANLDIYNGQGFSYGSLEIITHAVKLELGTNSKRQCELCNSNSTNTW